MHRFRPWILSAAVLLTLPLSAQATERNQLRALPGLPGFDLTAPLLPGMYFQTNYQHYSADKLNGDNGEPTVLPTPQPGVSARLDGKVSADVLALRGTWLSESTWGDGKLGLSMTVPLVRTELRMKPTLIGGPVLPAVSAAIAAQAAAASGKRSGVGDVEIAPFVDFQSDESRTTLALAVVAPTGRYDSQRPVNAGAGDFWTFRPVVTVARVFENGWELGARTSYSINTENRDTDYRSGQYLHSDLSALYAVSDTLKAGLAGYIIYQTTDDKGPGAAANGNRARAFGLGPTISWQAESGEWALESKFLKEFNTRNRPEGNTFWTRLFIRVN
ncbi:transporter [Chitinimonas sp. BJYL2]|uniref:SphA family protein n=1 Tax=Chitinimonas sp. BJYL2 TaxID=2976696 RepID=UPI0022B3F4CB|nr:transporter [Chitinimonas sp. BJYL2]